MTGRIAIRNDGQPATPLAIQVASSDGSLASVALHADPTGWRARLDDYVFFVTRVRTGPTATNPQ